MDSSDQPQISTEHLRSTLIPIAQISPTTERLLESSVHATVTLIWPYSSSTKSISLLLAEPDFRLRRSNGQVKVIFHGAVAENVAKSQVGIGDEVYLSLAGSRLVNNEAATQTPGRFVGWDVHLDDHVSLEVLRASKHLSTVKIDRPASPLPTTEEKTAPPATPSASQTRHEEIGPVPSLGSWGSPAFIQRSRASFGGTAKTALEPFAEEDGFVPGKGRKKPRFSMQNSDWRVIDEPESSSERADAMDWTRIFDEEESPEPEVHEEDQTENNKERLETPDIAGPTLEGGDISGSVEPENTSVPLSHDTPHTFKAPHGMERAAKPSAKAFDAGEFQVPELLRHRTTSQGVFNDPFHLPTDTPRLHPVPSPGLPVPSPLVSTSNSPHGYFTSIPTSQPQVNRPFPAEVPTEVEGLEPSNSSEVQPGTSQIRAAENSVIDSERTDQAVPSLEAVSKKPTINTNSEASSSTLIPRTAGPKLAAEVQPVGNNESAVEGKKDKPAMHVSEADFQMEDGVNHLGNDVIEVEEMEERGIQADGGESQKKNGFTEESLQQREELSEDDEDEYDEDEDEEDEEDEEDGDETSDEDEEEDGEDGEEEGNESEDEAREKTTDHDFISKGPCQPSQAEFIEDDSDGIIEEIPEKQNVAMEGLTTITDAQSPMESGDDTDGEHGYYVEDEENVDEETVDEEIYDEEEAEDVCHDEQGDYIESEYESDEVEEQGHQQKQQNTHPEIIVLDSDSEDEPYSNTQANPSRQAKKEITDLQKVELSESSTDEDSASEESGSESEVEDWSIVEEEQAEEEPVGDEPVWDEPVKTKDAGHEPTEREQTRSENVEDDRVDIHMTPLKSDAVPNPGLDEGLKAGNDNEVQDLHDPGLNIREDSIVESIQQNYMDTESAPQSMEMAIDPSLHQPEESAEDQPDANQEQGGPSHQPEVREEDTQNYPRPRQEVDDALFLDDAASPRLQSSTVTVFESSEISHRDFQLITPDTSQEVEAGKQTNTDLPTNESPLTPQQTQEASQPLNSHAGDRLSPQAQVVNKSAAPTEDGISSIEETDSLVLVSLEGRNEHQGNHVQENDQISTHYDEKGPKEHTARDHSPDGVEDTRQHFAEPDRHYPGLRSKLSYFSPLATLIDHFNTLVDTISIVCETSSIIQASSGNKDYVLTVQLTDPSLAGTMVTVQILRPYRTVLPSLTEGDAILLRNFKVKSFNHSMMLVSDDTSAWAVFDGSGDEARLTGPPVEYGSEELAYATDLRQWYLENGAAMVADHQLQASIEKASREVTPISSAEPSDAGSMESWRDIRGESSLSTRGSRRRKSHRRITIHELRDGRKYAEVGSPSDKESIHELRDGTAYAHL
ncbi:hypothetical protein MW887_007736 [Aspergillus wentii]|nr:hypothetical protein MW887_007736 [Aspergillus wentii]